MRAANSLESTGTTILEVYATEFQALASAATAPAPESLTHAASLLQSLSLAAASNTAVGDLLDRVVLLPLIKTIWAHLKAGDTCGPQAQLLGCLLQAHQKTLQAALLQIVDQDESSNVRAVVRRLLCSAAAPVGPKGVGADATGSAALGAEARGGESTEVELAGAEASGAEARGARATSAERSGAEATLSSSADERKGCLELLRAVCAARTALHEVLAAEVLELCDPGGKNLKALRAALEDSDVAKVQFPVAVVEAARVASFTPAISASATVLSQIVHSSPRETCASSASSAGHAGSNGRGDSAEATAAATRETDAWQGVLTLVFWRALVHGCQSCAALVGWHLTHGEPVGTSGNDAWSLSQLLVFAMAGVTSTSADTAGRSAECPSKAGEPSSGAPAHKALEHTHAEVLMPVAASISQRMLTGSNVQGAEPGLNVGIELTRCLFRAALPSLCSPTDAVEAADPQQLGDGVPAANQNQSEVAAAQWRLHFSQAAIADWQPSVADGQVESDARNAPTKVELASELCSDLATEALEHLLSACATEEMKADAGTLGLATAAAQTARVLDNIFALAHATGGALAVQGVWRAAMQAVPDLRILGAVRGCLAVSDTSDSFTLAQKIASATDSADNSQAEPGGSHRECTPKKWPLAPSAAALVALLLAFKDDKWLRTVPWLPAALALELALCVRAGDLRMAALAACVLHHAELLASGSPEPAGNRALTARGSVSNGTVVVAALAVVACTAEAAERQKGALESLVCLLSHLPQDVADSVAESLMCTLALAYASPSTAAPAHGEVLLHVLHEVQQQLSSTAAAEFDDSASQISSGTRSSRDGTAARRALERLASEWLEWLSKREPVLATDNDSAAAETQLGMRIVAVLLGPPELLEASGRQDDHAAALSAALALLNVLGPTDREHSPKRIPHGTQHAKRSDRGPGSAAAGGARHTKEAVSETDNHADSGLPALLTSDAPALTEARAAPDPNPMAARSEAGNHPDSSLAAALAAGVAHQLRSASVQLQLQQASPAAVDGLLGFVLTCMHAASHCLVPSTWHRIVACLQAYLTRVSTAAEVGAEHCAGLAVAIAEGIPGAPVAMDAAFALTFLFRLSQKAGIVSPAAREALVSNLLSPVPADASPAGVLLLMRLQQAAVDGEWKAARQEHLEELNAALLRCLICLGVCLHAAWVAGVAEEAAPRILAPCMQFWKATALCVVRFSGGVPCAVREFDAWSDELGVSLLDALVSIFTCSAAPLALRAAALSTAIHQPLLSRVGPVQVDNGCAFLPSFCLV